MRFQYGYYQFLDHFIGRNFSFLLHKKTRRKFYSKLHEILKKTGPGEIIPIDRRSNLSIKEFKKKYVRTGKPVVLEGAAKDWNCIKNWSLDYFKSLHGEDKVVMVDQIKMEEPAYFFLIPSFKKYMNSVVNGMKYHCETGKKVYKNQFGFHKKYSTK